MAVGPVGAGGTPRGVASTEAPKPKAIEPAVIKPDAGEAAAQDLFGAIGKTLSVIPVVGPTLGNVVTLAGGALTAAIAQAAKDGARLGEMKALLKDSPTGAAAVKYMEDKGIKVEFADGGGSYWDGAKIVIDRSKPMDRNALSLVHELNHAKGTLEGTSANINTDTRADYVAGELREEVAGTVDSIKTKNELLAAGKTVTSSYPLESEYNDAYKAASDALKARNPSATAAELKAAGEQAGSDRVMKGFKDGEVSTSTDGQNYPQYYGGAWDRKHPG